IDRIWDDGEAQVNILKHEGFFIDHRELRVDAAPERVFDVIKNIGGRNGWPYANWLWKLRGHFGVRKNAADSKYDYYSVDALKPDHLLLLHSQLKAPGEGWMEWRVEIRENSTCLIQTAYFTPHGLGGFLYWLFLYPFHVFVYRGMIRAIATSMVVIR
ncbi:MAG TPA: DUF2867 domain-containing protein, partial [Anaerolineales bacterium]|nr:DUF2867 domain-containing protein [Anaerolineales bacterium]